MFHVKHNDSFWPRTCSLRRFPRLPVPFAALGVLVVLLTAGCTGNIASPEGWAAPVGDDSFIVAQTERGELVAFEVENGRANPIWRYPSDIDDLDLEAIYATPIINRGVVYVASYGGIVVALDVSTGRLTDGWSAPTEIDGTIVATPVFQGDSLVVVVESGDVFTVDAATGDARKTELDGAGRVWGGPAQESGTLYLGDLGKDVRAIDIGSGDASDVALRWEQHLGGAVAGDLLIDGDLLLVGALDRKMRALEVDNDGETRWTFSGDGWFWAQALVNGSTVYASSVNGSVYAIDRATGDEQWQFHREDSEIRARPVLIDDVLVVAARDGFLFGVDPSNGELLWDTEIPAGRLLADPLVLESGVIFITNDGDLLRLTDVLTGRVETLFDRSES